jgi:hypothetical protein
MTEKDTQAQLETVVKTSSKTPNETGSISVEGFVKIYDPKNQEVFVEQRA